MKIYKISVFKIPNREVNKSSNHRIWKFIRFNSVAKRDIQLSRIFCLT